MMSSSTRLILGCGYLGIRVAERWRSAGHTVWVVTRSPERADELRRAGLRPLVADITEPDSLVNLPRTDAVLFAVGYDRQRYESVRDVYVRGLQNVVQRLPQPPQRFFYVSSTGVYGTTDGSWVNETTPAQPARPSGAACLEAERWLGTSPLAPVLVVLRLAGLYGPGRVPRLPSLDDQPLRVDPEGYLNLIHVDDAADLIFQLDHHRSGANLLLVADGHPVRRGEYLEYLAHLQNRSRVQFAPPGPAEPRSARSTGSKRVDTGRLRSWLNWQPRYPSYREGLAQALAQTQTDV